MKIIIARFVGTGSSLIRYSNGHMKQTYRQLRMRNYINKTLFLQLTSKLQSSQYRNISADPLARDPQSTLWEPLGCLMYL